MEDGSEEIIAVTAARQYGALLAHPGFGASKPQYVTVLVHLVVCANVSLAPHNRNATITRMGFIIFPDKGYLLNVELPNVSIF